jgi:hypothetical protein
MPLSVSDRFAGTGPQVCGVADFKACGLALPTVGVRRARCSLPSSRDGPGGPAPVGLQRSAGNWAVCAYLERKIDEQEFVRRPGQITEVGNTTATGFPEGTADSNEFLPRTRPLNFAAAGVNQHPSPTCQTPDLHLCHQTTPFRTKWRVAKIASRRSHQSSERARA